MAIVTDSEDNDIMTIALGAFDTLEAARQYAYKHKENITLYEDTKLVYSMATITEKDGIMYVEEGVGNITFKLNEDDKEECYTDLNIYKEERERMVKYLPKYKIYTIIYSPSQFSTKKYITRSEARNIMKKAYYYTMDIDDEKKEINLQEYTECKMMV